MPCNTPYRGDSSQLLLFKIASCCFDGGAGGVASFNGRAGAVTLLASDVTPVADDIYVNETGDSMSGLLDITTAATSLQAITSDAGAANTPETIQIYHQTSAVPLTGFGNRLQFYADTNGADNQIQARIDAQWVDAVDATRSSRLVFGTRNTGGVISSPLILTNGQLQLLDGLATIPSLSFQNDTDTGIYRIGANSFGSSAGGSVILATSTTGINLTNALAYQYNSVNVIRAQTALGNYFFGPSGNLTMTGGSNVSVGPSSFLANTTGSFNTSVGSFTLRDNTIGDGNTAVGYAALINNTTGTENTAIGSLALFTNMTGNNNMALGRAALFTNSSGSNNVAFGVDSLLLATGSANTAVGYRSLNNLTTGIQNTAIGAETGFGITTGSNNSILGANVTGLAAGLSNNIILADGAGVIRIQVDSAGVVTIPIALSLSTAAPLSMVSGANQRAGDVVLIAGTRTVANTTVTNNTRIYLTRKVSGGTIGFAVTYTVIAATSFTITSDNALDTSTYSYLLIEVP